MKFEVKDFCNYKMFSHFKAYFGVFLYVILYSALIFGIKSVKFDAHYIWSFFCWEKIMIAIRKRDINNKYFIGKVNDQERSTNVELNWTSIVLFFIFKSGLDNIE